jgi:hypothetical protein
MKPYTLIVKLFFLFLIVFFSSITCPYARSQGSWFVFTQLKYQGNWDPYPEAFEQIYHYLSNTTSLRMIDKRRIVTASDAELFSSPFLLFTGRGAYPEFSEEEIVNLRRYLQGGGIMLIDYTNDRGFELSVTRTMNRVFPKKQLIKISQEHALFRSFYLIDYVSGTVIRQPYLEGIIVSSRIAVIQSANDITGVWPRDRLGNWKNSLVPNRYRQRKEAIKLMLNILMYSVCGTYKNDPVHQPFIDEKLGR